MSALPVVVSIAGIVAICVATWAMYELGRASRSMRSLTDDAHERLVPLLEKADVTVDAANAELLRIDAAITRFEDASVRVSAASGTLSDIVQHPGEVVSGVADRVRRAWKDRRRTSDAPLSPADEEAKVTISGECLDQEP